MGRWLDPPAHMGRMALQLHRHTLPLQFHHHLTTEQVSRLSSDIPMPYKCSERGENTCRKPRNTLSATLTRAWLPYSGCHPTGRLNTAAFVSSPRSLFVCTLLTTTQNLKGLQLEVLAGSYSTSRRNLEESSQDASQPVRLPVGHRHHLCGLGRLEHW